MMMKKTIDTFREGCRLCGASLLTTMLCLMPATAMRAQTQTADYVPGVTTEGAVYYLPMTAVGINILVEKTTYLPGEFSKFAQRYLRLNDVSESPNASYRIIGFKVTPVGVADKTKAYAVKFDARTSACNVRLSDEGVLQAINAEPTTMPHIGTGGERGKSKPTPNPRQFMTEEILAAGSTTKMAELTASEIYDLRENRNLLIKGQADFMPKDGMQLKLMLQQIDTQERALSSMFEGTLQRDTIEHVFMVRPKEELKKTVVFRLSQKLGLVDNDDMAGAPYYITVEDLHAAPAAPTDEPAPKKKKPVVSGIYVNVPGKMRVTLYNGIEQLQSMELPAPQFGRVELLSGELFNKRYTTHLWLNPISGAIDKLEAEQPK